MVFLSDVVGLSGNLLWRKVKNHGVKVGHIFNMQVGPHLRSAEYIYAAVVNRMVG